jgi:23S rRNA pseudouridine2605 synthase
LKDKDSEKKRLQTVISGAGVTSRRKAAELIEEGRVRVGGKVIKEKGFRVDPAKERITVDEEKLTVQPQKYYFAFNKPKGVVCTLSDRHARSKITDFFRDIKARLYPVGRLDKDSEGIIILTNDGDLAYKLSHPKFNKKKIYEVLLERECPHNEIKRIERGILLEGKRTAKCRIMPLKKRNKGVPYKVEIHEGRKRQIRKMLAQAGNKVLSLKRTEFCGIPLGRLKPGEKKPLSRADLVRLKLL